MVAITELIELEVVVLAVRITCDGLQATKEQRLTHHTQILTERVHDLYALSQRKLLERLVITYLGQRVIKDLIESLCGQLLGDTATQLFRVRLDTVGQAGIEFLGELDVVVTVDTQNIFHYVALALYIYAVARHFQCPLSIVQCLDDFDLQSIQNRLYGVLSDRFADKAVDAVNINRHRPRIKTRLCLIGNLHRYLSACNLLNEQGCAFQYIQRVVRITTALVTEGGIRLQLMATAGLTYGHRIKISRLKEYVLRLLRHTALQTTEHTGDTHCFLGVSNHQVAFVHLALHTIKGSELLARTCHTHMYLFAFYLIGIECMERLTAFVEYEVRHIHYVIDRS